MLDHDSLWFVTAPKIKRKSINFAKSRRALHIEGMPKGVLSINPERQVHQSWPLSTVALARELDLQSPKFSLRFSESRNPAFAQIPRKQLRALAPLAQVHLQTQTP